MANIPTPEDFRQEIKGTRSVAGRRKAFLREFERMTEKQQAVFRLLMVSPDKLTTPKALCQEAGYKINDYSRASATLKTIEGKLGVSLCEIFGVTEYDLLRVLVDAINADDVKPIVVKQYDKKGVVIGEKIELVKAPNHRIRLSSAQVLIRLGNYEPLKKIKVEGEIVHTMNKASIETLREREAAQRAQLTTYEVVDGDPN